MDFLVESTTNQVQNTGGIALAGKIAGKISEKIAEKIGLHFTDNESKQEIKHPEVIRTKVIRTMYGLYVQGRTSFEEIKLFRYNETCQKLLS